MERLRLEVRIAGSFFEFIPDEGSFYVRPPETEHLIDKTALHLLRILQGTLSSSSSSSSSSSGGSGGRRLSFVVLVPDWSDTEGIQLMSGRQELQPFKKEEFVIQRENIRDGTQCFVFQSEAGAWTWPVPPRF
eukprot:Filipodium_phascolosomae@DN2674_c0_g1_i14.p1